MNFKLVLDWVRRHVFIVVFGVIIIAAPVTGWLIGGRLKGGVVNDLNSKKSDMDALSSLEASKVTLNIPGREPVTVQTTVNRQVIDSYSGIVEALRADADTVRTAALRHNSKNRDVLLTEIFPAPPDARRADAHERFYPALVAAYQALLEEIRAGQPPPTAEVREQLQRRSSAFIASVGGGKRTREELNPDDRKRLDDDLLGARKSIYAEVARGIGLYATLESIGMPRLPSNIPSTGMPLDRMFEWNWNLWVTQDVVRGLAAANAGFDDVTTAPVKRIVQLRVEPLPRGEGRPMAPAGTDDDGGGGGGGGGGSPVDPRSEVQRDFSMSFTGRLSNSLYDVRRVTLRVIIETAQLPRVVDALARQNFITVTNVDLVPVDPFAAAREGFLYGAEPLSEATLTLETIQLREWTTLRMPAEMKARIGTSGLGGSSGGDEHGGL
ncbi:MAG: hypothetical protein KF724_13245 [Phycisphaeraceae bacterium]|nr:hypothetical protein [Phycisphaeraceae bacterium]